MYKVSWLILILSVQIMMVVVDRLRSFLSCRWSWAWRRSCGGIWNGRGKSSKILNLMSWIMLLWGVRIPWRNRIPFPVLLIDNCMIWHDGTKSFLFYALPSLGRIALLTVAYALWACAGSIWSCHKKSIRTT